MERDSQRLSKWRRGSNFNSHAHVERDFGVSNIDKTQLTFQLTRSRGAWRHYFFQEKSNSNFNSHAHVERDDKPQPYLQILINFNSHAHVERDHVNYNWKDNFWHFNSHAHVERDVVIIGIFLTSIISTHTLTWSVTSSLSVHQWCLAFQLTRSRGAWRTFWDTQSAKLRFQLTRSRGAWH